MDTPISRTYCALQWKQTRIKSVHAQLRDLTNNKCRYSDHTVTKLILNSLLLLQLYIKIVLKPRNVIIFFIFFVIIFLTIPNFEICINAF